ncbi:MAG TPA: pseudouridine synthase [Casimicrobiaceae bacterium]|nr:pseudouridine synthase [Casimicrobiaceae bacterium]
MEELILAGRITVNRMPAEIGQKVGPGDEVRINGEVVKVRFAEPRPRVLMYHKPAGEIVTRDDPEGRPTVFAKLPSIGNGRWINIGRLDYNTEGLLLFTNSGELANRMMHPRYEVEREYAVRVMGRLSDDQMRTLTEGVQLEDGPARVEKVTDGGGDEDGANRWYHVVLKEGRNREVRRIFEALGLMVSRLIRTRFGMIAMPSSLKRGQMVELESADVDALVASAGLRAGRGPSPADGPRNAHPAKGKRGRPGMAPGRARPPHPARPGMDVPVGAGTDGFAQSPQGAPAHGPRPGQNAHPRKGRPWKQRGAKPGANGAPPSAKPFVRKPGKPKPPQDGRPPRARHDFDEKQPHSNANAAPFARTSATGNASHGYGNNGPRQRSGPRAKRVAQANGRGGRQLTGGGSDRVELSMPSEYNVPKRPTRQPQIRAKRTRTVVQADMAADAADNPALRRLLLDEKS